MPAVTVLLLVACTLAGVGLALSSRPAPQAVGPSAAPLGLEAAFGVRNGNAACPYSEAEREALSRPLPANATKVDVPVLMYHYVDDEPPPAGPYADALTVRTPDFIEEMEFLADHGHHTVSLADAYLAMAGLRELPSRPVILTFDDGGLDNYEVAFPVLKKYGFTATFFVITKTVGKPGQMNWDQLEEMAAAGMAVQSHTVSHPDLTGIPHERLRSELAESRSIIVETLERPVYALSYPGGAYDEGIKEATRLAGYVMAVATDRGASLEPSMVFEIKRKRIPAFLSIESFAGLVN